METGGQRKPMTNWHLAPIESRTKLIWHDGAKPDRERLPSGYKELSKPEQKSNLEEQRPDDLEIDTNRK